MLFQQFTVSGKMGFCHGVLRVRAANRPSGVLELLLSDEWCQELSLRRCPQLSRSPPRMEISLPVSLPSPRRSRFRAEHRGPRHSSGCLTFGARLTFFLRLFKAYEFPLILARWARHSSFQRRSCLPCWSPMLSSSACWFRRSETGGFVWQHRACPPEVATGTPIVYRRRVRIVLA